ncbi:MAG TPA: hypothetical protein VMA13_10365 [Candidatus Saccharimonadales bacterium]|nr:hypothetical protein [Candidatus Saccharimonadales bacterium]
MPTRRQFLISCSTLTLAASFVPASFVTKSFRTDEVPLDRLAFDTFRDCNGSIFAVLPEGAPSAWLKLVAVERHQPIGANSHTTPDVHNEKFSLLFRQIGGPLLSQDTYVFEHSGLGRFGLFIVPVRVGKDLRQDYYQAVFNRLPC